jgi:hypothetical protein
LVQLIPAMDSSAWRSVAGWLSAHLSNTKLAWPYWDYWCSEYASSGEDSVHRSFMALLVEQCTLASLPERLRNALPTSVHGAVPPSFSFAVPGVFSSASDDPLAPLAAELKERIEKREDADEVEEWLSEGHAGVDDTLQVQYIRAHSFIHSFLAAL